MITIQVFQESDAPDLALLMPQWMEAVLGDPEALLAQVSRLRVGGTGDVFVARTSDGTLIGYLQVAEYVLLGKGIYAEVVALLVHDAYRGLGYGKALIAKAEEWASDRGLEQMILSSQVHRIEAHALYMNFGYEHFKHSYYFTKNLKESA